MRRRRSVFLIQIFKGCSGFKFKVQQLMLDWCSAFPPRMVLHGGDLKPALCVAVVESFYRPLHSAVRNKGLVS